MPVSSATRAETLAEALRQAIREGRYMSGERLIELALAQTWRVSQNTVREALRILESEGWVVKHARRGVYVRSFTPQEAEEVFALWAAVEGLALRWAMDSLTKTALAGLRRLIHEARKQALIGELRGALDTLFTLHTAIGAMSGRPQTQALLDSLRNRVYLLEILRQHRAPRSLHACQAQIILYEKLLSLMETGQTDAAQSLLHYLIMDDAATLLPSLERR